jgi:hypothetical protein
MKYLIYCVVAVFISSAVWAERRTWTSLDGKTAVAEFQSLEGNTLVLLRGTKLIRVPLAAFSEEDQAYVARRLEEELAALERAALEKRERMQLLLGYRAGVSIATRRWPDWKSYYEETSCGSKVLRFFKNEASIVDVRDRGVFVSPEAAVRPADYDPTMMVYCPEDYDGDEQLGVYIHISAGNKGVKPNTGYRDMMDKHRLIDASPNGAGNDQADMRRLALTLDTLAQLRADFNVDEDRVYVGGTSGGGAESTMAAFMYPQDFRAALNSVRSFSLTSSTCLPFADKGDIDDTQEFGQPYAFISGSGDFNYDYMPRTVDSFEEHDFVVRFFDIPGMKHQMASAETFDEVIQWVEANNPRLKK